MQQILHMTDLLQHLPLIIFALGEHEQLRLYHMKDFAVGFINREVLFFFLRNQKNAVFLVTAAFVHNVISTSLILTFPVILSHQERDIHPLVRVKTQIHFSLVG